MRAISGRLGDLSNHYRLTWTLNWYVKMRTMHLQRRLEGDLRGLDYADRYVNPI